MQLEDFTFMQPKNIAFIRKTIAPFNEGEQKRIEIEYAERLYKATKDLVDYKKVGCIKDANIWFLSTYENKALKAGQQQLIELLHAEINNRINKQLKETYREDVTTSLLRSFEEIKESQSLIEAVKSIENFNNKYSDFKFYGYNDSNIIKLANKAAKHCADLARKHQKDLTYAIKLMHEYADSLHIKRATTNNDNITVILNKYTDPLYFRPRLRRVIRRRREELAFDCDLINPNYSKYSSKFGQIERKQQLDRNQKWADKSIITNGETIIKMNDLIASKEECYQAELTTMLKGLSDTQDNKGWSAALITVTCPSRMHKYKYNNNNKRFYKNKKFDGTLPRESVAHLRIVWTQARSQAKRENLDFRMCQVWQPHADACFHQHQFIVADEETIARFYEIVNEKALKVDGDENGAKQRRTDLEMEDRSKGRLASYAAKYVTRYANKDGESCATDKATPEDAAYSAHSVRRVGWVSTPPKYLWNLFRTITKDCCNKTMRKLRKAARAGEYANFCEILKWNGNKKDTFERFGIEIIKDFYETKHGEILKKRFAITFMNVSIFDKSKGEKWFIETVRTVTHNYPRAGKPALFSTLSAEVSAEIDAYFRNIKLKVPRPV